jgi:hypothetical protein
MLNLTAAARAEDGAKRLRAQRRTRQQAQQFGYGVLGLNALDDDAGALLRERSKAKNNDAARAPDGLAVGKQIREIDLDFGAGWKCRGGGYPLTRYSSARQGF